MRIYRSINSLFCVWMERRLKKLDQKLIGDAIILKRIFSPKKLFYDTSDLSVQWRMEYDFTSDLSQYGIQIKNNQEFSKLLNSGKSQTFAFNINCFCQMNGFIIVHDIIKSQSFKSKTLTTVRKLLKSVANMVDYMTDEEWKKYCQPIGISAYDNYLKDMNVNDLDDVTIKDIIKIIKEVKRLLKGPYGNCDVKRVDSLELDLGTRLLAYSSIDKRKAGIGIICNKIKTLKQECNSEVKYSQESIALAKLFQERNILEMLFGTDLHADLITKAGEILTFMYKLRVISGKDIIKIWEIGVEKENKIQTAIMNVIKTVVLNFTTKDANEIIEEIRNFPLKKMKECMVPVFASLSINEYYRSLKYSHNTEEKKLLGGTKLFESKRVNVEEQKDSNYIPTQRMDYDLPQPLLSNNTELARNRLGLDLPSRMDQEIEQPPFIPDEDPDYPMPPNSSEVLNYMWILTHEEALIEGLALNVQSQIIDSFISILGKYYSKRLPEYVQYCQEMISADKSFNQEAKIYKKLVEMSRGSGVWKPNSEDLIQKVVITLIKFKRHAAQKAIELTDRQEEDEYMDTQSSIDDKMPRDIGKIEDLGPLAPVQTENMTDNQPNSISANTGQEPKDVKISDLTIVEEDKKEEKKNDLKPKPEIEICAPTFANLPPLPMEVAVERPRDIYETLVTNEALNITYYEELNERLKLLLFLIVEEKQKIKTESIEIMWQILLFNSSSKKEAGIFFNFMSTLIKSPHGMGLIVEGIFDSFLFEVLLKIDERHYSIDAFECLKMMFVTINSCYKHMHILPNAEFEISDLRLIGIDTLWEIAILAKENSVQKNAADFIFDLYTKPANPNQCPEPVKKQEDFTARCIKNIQMGISNSKDGKLRIGRALDLLCRYLTNCDKITFDQKVPALPLCNFPLTVIMNGIEKITMQVDPAMSIKRMQEKFLETTNNMSVPLSNFLFLINGNNLQSSDCTLFESNINPDSVLSVTSLEEGISLTSNQKPKKDDFDFNTFEKNNEAAINSLKEMFPNESTDFLKAALRSAGNYIEVAAGFCMEENRRNDLIKDAELFAKSRTELLAPIQSGKLSIVLSCNNDFFSPLYDLLSINNPELVEKAWLLLSNIPLNPKKYDEIFRLKDCLRKEAWNDIFQVHNYYKLMYNLQIIWAIIQSGMEKNVCNWIDSFVKMRGIDSLCRLLADLPIKDIISNCLTNKQLFSYLRIILQAIEVITKIIKRFMVAIHVQQDSKLYNLYQKEKLREKSEENDYKNRLGVFEENQKIALNDIKEQYFIEHLIIVLSLISEETVGKDSINAVRNAMSLFSILICFDLKYLDQMQKNEQFKKYLKKLMIESSNDELKNIVVNELKLLFTVYDRCNYGEGKIIPLRAFFFNSLIEMLPFLNEKCQNCELYFKLLGEYFNPQTYSEISKFSSVKGVDIAKQVCKSMCNRMKKDITQIGVDKQLEGYICLLSKLIIVQEDLFKEISFNSEFDLFNCLLVILFGASTSLNYQRIYSSTITHYVCKFLIEYAKNSSENYNKIMERLISLHNQQLKYSVKDIGNENGAKAASGYVGLKNLGCTCYINSLLQQLYMMPDLRKQILDLQAGELEKVNCDRVIINLQRIFANLRHSHTEYFVPNDFCNDFKDANKHSINVLTQQDVDEFFNLLTEKIENELTILNANQIIKENLEITIKYEYTSLEAELEFSSEILEPHLCLPLSIKDNKTIQEAIDFFVKEEILEGENKYLCSKNNTLIRASKKCYFEKLPSTMILNLKRFEFNKNTGYKKKLNDYCEFPLSLNFYKWTKDAAKQIIAENLQEYDYDLVGVLIHQGTVDGGHYFSFIKEREPDSPNYNKWFEFNDTRVRPFDISELDLHAFGIPQTDDIYPAHDWEHDTNAYLLFYQKSQKKNNMTIQLRTPNKYASILEEEANCCTNSKIYIDSAYKKFVLDFLALARPTDVDCFSSKESEPESSKDISIETSVRDISLLICKIAVLYGQDLNIKAKGLDNFKDWIGLIKPHLQTNALASVWLIKYLTENKKLLFDYLLVTGNETLRKDFTEIVAICMQKIAKIEEGYFNQVFKLQSIFNAKTFTLVPATATERFIRLLIEDGINRSRYHYQRFNEFYQLLCSLATLGYKEAAVFILAEAIYFLIDFVSNTTTALKKANMSITNSRKEILDTTMSFSGVTYFKEPIRLLTILICSCYTKPMKQFGKAPNTALLPLEHLSGILDIDVNLFFNNQWCPLDLEMHNAKDLTTIILHLSWEQSEVSLNFAAQLKKEVIQSTQKQIHFSEIIKILREFLLIKDSLMKTRNQYYFEYSISGQKGFLLELSRLMASGKGVLLEYLAFLAEIISNEIIASVFQTYKPKMLWIPSWIVTNFKIDEQTKFILKQFAEILDLKEDPTQSPPIEDDYPLPKLQKAGGVLETGYPKKEENKSYYNGGKIGEHQSNNELNRP